MCFSPNQKGNIITGLLCLVSVGALAGLLMDMVFLKSKVTEKKIRDSATLLRVESGIETALVAYRMAEAAYAIQASHATPPCPTANPFGTALRYGTNCAGVDNFQVFTSTDFPAYTSDLFDYPVSSGPGNPVGCKLYKDKASDCQVSGGRKLLDMGITTPSKSIGGYSYELWYLSAVPEKQITEFVLVVLPQRGGASNPQTSFMEISSPLKQGFAIRQTFANAAHLESDGRVTQENPDPLDKCQGKSWGDFILFDASASHCRLFSQLGGGTGLAYYKGRYFGFRPQTGDVIDLYAASSDGASPGSPPDPNSYMVQESGYLTGHPLAVGEPPLFPPYHKDTLINVDDITVIKDRIYTISGQGSAAAISSLVQVSSSQWELQPICPLGTLGWAQAYNGIAAVSWSDPVQPGPAASPGPSPVLKMATFFLKTDGGDSLMAEVIGSPAVDLIGDPSSCAIFKDTRNQPIEYKRTNGFDRTEDAKPYFIY